MRLTIKAKQVLGVTSIVGLAVVALSGLYVASLVRVRLEESLARGKVLTGMVFHRARTVVTPDKAYEALRADEVLQSTLEACVAYSPNVTYAAIADVNGIVIVHNDRQRVDEALPASGNLEALLTSGVVDQLRTIYSQGQTLEVTQPLLLDSTPFGSIRIGVSTLLIRNDINSVLGPALVAVAAALVGSSVVAMLLAQLLLRPIHVLRRSLTKLGERDFGVGDALPHDEFGELGESLAMASARLLADRAGPTDGPHDLEGVTSWLEDAVAVFDEEGTLVFANAGMRTILPGDPLGQPVGRILTPEHPYRAMVDDGLKRGHSAGPFPVHLPEPAGVPENGPSSAPTEQLVRSDVLRDRSGKLAGVLLVARDTNRLRQIRSTLNYARRVATLGRLSAGLAHEIKNPLNATMIRLELLRQQLSPESVEALAGGGRRDVAMGSDGSSEIADFGEHVEVISAQIRRLDEVVQGFLKFIRPEDVRLQPVALSDILAAIMPIIDAEAQSHGVEVRTECPAGLPDLGADPPMLEQAFLNLAINACQAMPEGGTLRISATATWGRYVEVRFEDTGVGIQPAHLDRIFDLYFTTKEGGSGIGLSMVFRAVHLHGGEITVESTPGRGTTFRLLLPQA